MCSHLRCSAHKAFFSSTPAHDLCFFNAAWIFPAFSLLWAAVGWASVRKADGGIPSVPQHRPPAGSTASARPLPLVPTGIRLLSAGHGVLHWASLQIRAAAVPHPGSPPPPLRQTPIRRIQPPHSASIPRCGVSDAGSPHYYWLADRRGKASVPDARTVPWKP